MFKIPRVNVIESDEGFSVEVLGRDEIKYVEGNKSLIIESEFLMGNQPLAVFADTIKKWDSGQTIDEKNKRRIMDNITRAFAFDGTEIDITW